MNQMEEIEYRLQKLEATVEQMEKDSFWNKQPRRVSREAIIEANRKMIEKGKEAKLNSWILPCMWDSIPEEDKKKPMMLSCPCPKCNATF